MKKTMEDLRATVNQLQNRRHVTRLTPNNEDKSNHKNPYDQVCNTFDKHRSGASLTSAHDGRMQLDESELCKPIGWGKYDARSNNETSRWQYRKPKAMKVKPKAMKVKSDEIRFRALDAEADKLLNELELSIQQTRAELSQMKSTIKRKRLRMQSKVTERNRRLTNCKMSSNLILRRLMF